MMRSHQYVSILHFVFCIILFFLVLVYVLYVVKKLINILKAKKKKKKLTAFCLSKHGVCSAALYVGQHV